MATLSDRQPGPQIPGGKSAQQGGEPQARDDDPAAVVRWIPILVPLFAVLIASVAYLVGWGVLD